MVRVTMLGSGSRGNAMIIDTGRTRVAVDAGFGPRTLARRMRIGGIAPQSIDVCAITHEHLDHGKGAVRARNKWRWALASTAPTLAAIGALPDSPDTHAMEYGEPAEFGTARLTLIRISHDAAAPAAVLIEDTVTGARIGVAHDLGEIPDGLVEAFAGLDFLVLEANHDPEMLRTGPYPPVLQARIANKNGHLSNAQSAEFAARVAHKGLRAVILAHLSEQNNTPEFARRTVGRALKATAFRGTLIAARQNRVSAVGDRAMEQLALF